MTPEKFVSKIKNSIVDENIAIYEKLFASTPVSVVTDLYWKRALTLYQSLEEDNRMILFEIIHQSVIDTASAFLGILDGVSPLDGALESFNLTNLESHQKINGNLQDLFLEINELDQGRNQTI